MSDSDKLPPDKYAYRQTAINTLKDRAEQLMTRGKRLMGLAELLESTNIDPESEEALWELAVQYRG